MRRLLQLGAGGLQKHSLRQLREAGYYVFAIDKNPEAPGASYADEFDAIDISDPKAVTAYCKEKGIEAIIAINDAGVLPAAVASEACGLNYLSPHTAAMCTDKGLMREAWAGNSLRQPAFKVVSTEKEIRDTVAEMGLPLIIKPCLNWGSRGISVIESEKDVDFAVKFALENDRNKRFIIEEFIPGTEMTIEGLVKEGDISILSKSDKVPQENTKYRVAMQLNYPSQFPKEVLEEVDALVRKAAIALGINNGAIHCEVMVNNSGAYLLEMAARPGGGHIFGMIVEAQSGVCMPVALAKILLKEEIDIAPKWQKGVSYRFFAPPPGIYKGIEGLETAKRYKGILDFDFQMKPGTNVDAISGDADRPGYLVAVGYNSKEAVAYAESAIGAIKFL